MDGGTDDRSRLRLHVRAAREWLGRAEESLGKSEDVRGDLNLMLARAELIRAQETEHPNATVVWTRRFAPLSVAILLAGVGYWMWRGAAGVQEVPQLPVERRVESMAPPPKPIEAAIPIPQTAAPVEAEILEPPDVRSETEETATVQEMDAPETSAPPPVRLPSEDMQRLMNSAGQSLRAIQ